MATHAAAGSPFYVKIGAWGQWVENFLNWAKNNNYHECNYYRCAQWGSWKFNEFTSYSSLFTFLKKTLTMSGRLNESRTRGDRMLKEDVDKKYELTKKTIKQDGHTLHRIRALKDFNDVKAGDLGGWVESEDNLSQEGNCWVYRNAKVYDDAEVSDNACVWRKAKVYGSAKVYGEADVFMNSQVYENAEVYGNADILGQAEVYGNAKVYENAEVSGKSLIYGNAKVHGDVEITGSYDICEDADIESEDDLYDLEDIEESYSRKGRMLKEESTETYIVPEWTLPYLFNDDPSGLNDDEIEAVDKFVESLPSALFDASEDTFFAHYNDLPGEQGRLGNTCVELTVVIDSER